MRARALEFGFASAARANGNLPRHLHTSVRRAEIFKTPPRLFYEPRGFYAPAKVRCMLLAEFYTSVYVRAEEEVLFRGPNETVIDDARARATCYMHV